MNKSYSTSNIHIPVLKEKVIEFLNIKKGKYYFDGTVGCGGHTLAMLEAAGGNIFVLGTDRDKDILEIAKKEIDSKGYSSKVFLYHSRFSKVVNIIKELGWKGLDGVLLDLGISSYQVDMPERGFSFHELKSNSRQSILYNWISWKLLI
jgi:16S rRNA (cytosine1402-N4)-methyltransferase